MTFPVGFHAVLLDLTARIDGRILTAKASNRTSARSEYEAALDDGKLTILHEERLRGIHIISVGQLLPGKEAEITSTSMMPISILAGTGYLRIPTSVGQIYGTSTAMPSDDFSAAQNLQTGSVLVRHDGGQIYHHGALIENEIPLQITLDKPIELVFHQPEYGILHGRDAAGKRVKLSLAPSISESRPLDLTILFDRSGSTAELNREARSVWDDFTQGLALALNTLNEEDQIHLWQFDNTASLVGSAKGPNAARLIPSIERPGGGTELGKAISKAVKLGAEDILVLTDGRTNANEVQAISALGLRVSVVLAGEQSLDAMAGHLVAMTGGQLIVAPPGHEAEAIQSVMSILRTPAADPSDQSPGNKKVAHTIAGMNLSAEWTNRAEKSASEHIGRYCAALVLPHMQQDEATDWAIKHNLCTHLTSLVLVDEQGSTSQSLPEMRQIGVMVGEVPLYMSTARQMPISARIAKANSPECHGAPIQQNYKIVYKQIEKLSLSINWGRFGPQLALGETGGLPLRIRIALWKLALNSTIRTIAKQAGVSPLLACIALTSGAIKYKNIEAKQTFEKLFQPMNSGSFQIFSDLFDQKISDEP